MPNRWQKKDLDILILKLVNEHKALMGETIKRKISMKYPEYNEVKIHNRIQGLCRVKMLDREVYKLTTRKACRKVGTLYYLSRLAVDELNKMGIPVVYKPVKARDKDGLYMHSQVLEHIPLPLVSGAVYKTQNKLHNFGIIDFVYNDWEIVICQTGDKNYENILIQQAKAAVKGDRKKRLYICKNRPQKFNIIKRFMEEHINYGMFAEYSNITTITSVLTEQAQTDIDQYVSKCYGFNVLSPGQYETPTGKIVKVYNLVGYNPKTMRQIKHETELSYIGFASMNEMQYYRSRVWKKDSNHILFALDQEPELFDTFAQKCIAEEIEAPQHNYDETDPWGAAYVK